MNESLMGFEQHCLMKMVAKTQKKFCEGDIVLCDQKLFFFTFKCKTLWHSYDQFYTSDIT